MYIFTEASCNHADESIGVATKIFSKQGDARKALFKAYENARKELWTHPVEAYCNASCGLIRTECEYWYGVIEEVAS